MNNSFDILFLAGLFPKEKEDEIIGNSKGNVQNAANALQHGIASGLSANCPGQVRILNSLYVGPFPRLYKELFIKTYNFSHVEGANDINIGYINLVGVKRLSRYITLKPYVRKWIKEKSDRKKVIIAYAATATFTRLLRYTKKLDSNIVTCLVVPDLPQYMNMTHRQSAIYRLLKGFEAKLIQSDTEYIDGFVLLTKQMRDALHIEVPFVVIEGIATDTFENMEDIPKNQEVTTFLYSGTLAAKYGIIDLVKAFQRLPDENCRLVICGAGETEEYIKNESKRDGRIVFKGLLKREDVLKLQKTATVLINPRSNNEEYTKYSFPSKIIEYMASGTPVISYKLNGVSEEYYDYLFTIDDGLGEDAIYFAIKDVLSKSEEELEEMGKRAKAFVLTEKSSNVQAGKILRLVEDIANKNQMEICDA